MKGEIMTETQAIKFLQAIIKETTLRINNPHIGRRSWNYDLYIEQRQKAKSRIRALRGDCQISKGLVLDAIKKEKQSRKMADFLTGLNIA
jgi:hypothetical protein